MYRILVVEDDMTIAKALASHLRKWDYEVACVEDFKNVMEIFAEYDPQLVLLDIVLPFFLWVSLVPGDPSAVKGAHHLYLFGGG